MKVKLSICALLALLVATMICSSVRAEELETPQSLLLELKETVLEADDMVFKGYTVTNTRQRKNALARKIDATIRLCDFTEQEEAADKLVDDIRPKLTDPWDADGARKPACSWLESYPEDSDEWRAVSSFAAGCQVLIERIFQFYWPRVRGTVRVVPSLIHPRDEYSFRFSFKSYVPYTVTVYAIYYEIWKSAEIWETEWHDPSSWDWITGTVPPYQEVEICRECRTCPPPDYAAFGNYWLGAVFFTSEGGFPASCDFRISLIW